MTKDVEEFPIELTMMSSTGKSPLANVLIVDDEENQRIGLEAMVSAWGYRAETASDGRDALEKLGRFPADVLITDIMMPRMDGMALLGSMQEHGIRIPAIVTTAFGNIETAVSTIHDLGAFWFLEKPIQPSVLKVLLERAAAQSNLAGERERLRRALSYQGVLGDLVGQSPAMQQVFSLIQQVAPSRASVLITGESGTGKELVARAIHQYSPRREGPFVAINCAALPETLIESELFGHEKGAFTGAVERRAGCFELAEQGTILLDELGEMPVNTQAKLLRVLEDSRVRRLGGKNEMDVNVRVLASTNRLPEAAIEEGKLREDLFYRLNVFHLHLPALRERKSDLPLLTEGLLRTLNAKHSCKVAGVEPEVAEAFLAYDWPGNVRELRNVLERAVILAGEGVIRLPHLPSSVHPQSKRAAAAREDDPLTVTLTVGNTVAEAERAMIFKTLEHTKNNKTRAAEMLGISLKTMHNKLKEYEASGEN
ncbi:MAG: sigma-54 dependent transcriptional regulator [Bryobacterales bacterium]|nr:sigma-54 dependent transcriptional regulator [Bryobacterales bacterium]